MLPIFSLNNPHGGWYAFCVSHNEACCCMGIASSTSFRALRSASSTSVDSSFKSFAKTFLTGSRGD
uniref:Uncharacterized protein n=1 Tax=Romanomermis culicivorax TaxID=13658 RepID=A0A915LD38_ROMCU